MVKWVVEAERYQRQRFNTYNVHAYTRISARTFTPKCQRQIQNEEEEESVS